MPVNAPPDEGRNISLGLGLPIGESILKSLAYTPRTRSIVPVSEVRPRSQRAVRSISDTDRNPAGNSPLTLVPRKWTSAAFTMKGDSERC